MESIVLIIDMQFYITRFITLLTAGCFYYSLQMSDRREGKAYYLITMCLVKFQNNERMWKNMNNGKMGVLPHKSELSTDKVHLTDAGEKLLEVMKIPELRMQSVTKICEHAGISRDSYYRLFRSPDFVQKYSELCKDVLLSFAMPASMALGRQAELGDPSCIKMILEMSGIYQPKASVEHVHTIEAGQSLLEMYRARKEPKELTE